MAAMGWKADWRLSDDKALVQPCTYTQPVTTMPSYRRTMRCSLKLLSLAWPRKVHIVDHIGMGMSMPMMRIDKMRMVGGQPVMAMLDDL